jgi:repressor LexA
MFDREKKKETLRAIRHLTRLHGYPPTVRELAGHIEMSPTGTNYRISILVRDGLLSKTTNSARSLVLTREGRNFIGV